MARKTVLIENPKSDCDRVCMNRARRHVKQGRAEWTEINVSIRFVETSTRNDVVTATIEDMQEAQRRTLILDQSETDYDCAADSGLADHKQMRGLPFAGPNLIGLLTLQTAPTRRASIGPRLKSRVIVKDFQPTDCILPARA